MRRLAWSALLLCGVVTWSGRAEAYRPFDGTDADVAHEGEYELEIGPGYIRRGDERFGVLPWMINNYGIAPGHELVLEGKHLRSFSEPTLVARSRVIGTGFFLKSIVRRGSMQGEAGPSVATEIGPVLPQIADSHAFGASLTTIISQRWRPLAVHLNLGNVLDRDRHYVLFLGTIVEAPLEWRVRPVAEVYLERTFGSRSLVEGLVRSALLGAIYRARDDLAFDVGVRLARDSEASAFELRAGLTFGISLAGKR